jgi:hypothetical protein
MSYFFATHDNITIDFSDIVPGGGLRVGRNHNKARVSPAVDVVSICLGIPCLQTCRMIWEGLPLQARYECQNDLFPGPLTLAFQTQPHDILSLAKGIFVLSKHLLNTDFRKYASEKIRKILKKDKQLHRQIRKTIKHLDDVDHSLDIKWDVDTWQRLEKVQDRMMTDMEDLEQVSYKRPRKS